MHLFQILEETVESVILSLIAVNGITLIDEA
jgi:hypothetical protein